MATERPFKLEVWEPKRRGRRPYVARFYYRNSVGETVAVDSRPRPHQGARNLVEKARNQLADDLREANHLIAVEFANWMDEPRDGVLRVNPRRSRPLVKLSKSMHAVMAILDSSPDEWMPFARLRRMLSATTESLETSLHQTIKRLRTGHSRRRPLVETMLDDHGRLLVRALAIPEQ